MKLEGKKNKDWVRENNANLKKNSDKSMKK